MVGFLSTIMLSISLYQQSTTLKESKNKWYFILYYIITNIIFYYSLYMGDMRHARTTFYNYFNLFYVFFISIFLVRTHQKRVCVYNTLITLFKCLATIRFCFIIILLYRYGTSWYLRIFPLISHFLFQYLPWNVSTHVFLIISD